MNLVPVDHDPFAAAPPQLIPVDHDPFASQEATPSFGFQGQKPPGFFSEISANAQAGYGALQDLANNNVNTGPSPQTDALVNKVFTPKSTGGFGDTMAGLIGNRLMGDYSDAMGKPDSNTIRSQDVTGAIEEKMGQSAPGKALTAIQGLTPANPIATAVNRYVNPLIERATNLAPQDLQMMEMLYGTKGGADAIRNVAGTTPPMLSDIGANAKKLGAYLGEGSGASVNTAGLGIPGIMASKPPAYDPIAGNRAMADTYGANKTQSGELYDKATALATGKPIDTAGLANNINGLIAEVESDPVHEARGVLPRLRKLADKINSATPTTIAKTTNGETPVQAVTSPEKFDLADALELKKIMNEGFKSNRWTQNAKGTIYGDVGAQVGKIISDASVAHPDFGAANDLAHNYWLNNVHNPFQDNSVMTKYFTPDDLREHQSLAEGRTQALHDETMQRANKTVPNIKNDVQLNAVRRALPEKLGAALSKDVIKAQGNSGRLQAAGRAALGALDLRPHGIARTVNNLADVIGGVQKTPEQIALIKAAKSPSPRMATAEELAKALAKRKP